MCQTKELSVRANRTIGRLLVLVGLVPLLIVPAAFAQKSKPSPTPTSIPLNVEFAPECSITGDGQAYSDAYQNVRADIYYGNFYFDTNENKGDGGRRVYLSFPSNCSNCPGSGPKDVYLATTDGGVPQFDLAGMTSGQLADKRCAISWGEGAYTYYLRHTGSAGLGYVRFECRTEMAGSCTQWMATPTGMVGLYSKPTKGGGSETFLGSLSMPFEMTLTRP